MAIVRHAPQITENCIHSPVYTMAMACRGYLAPLRTSTKGLTETSTIRAPLPLVHDGLQWDVVADCAATERFTYGRIRQITK